MPIDRSPINKPEKKDYKQEFLDMIANQSGPLAAATMEQAFKHQNTQIEEAMGQGMTINDISQTVAQQLGGPQTQQPQQPNRMASLGPAIGSLMMAMGEGAFGVSPSQTAVNMAKAQNGGVEDPSLVRYRNAMSALAEKQYQSQTEGAETNLVYRDPVTGEEVSPEQAKKDTAEGLGIYQVNQKIVTRSGVQEKTLNKVPDLTQEEKMYINQSRVINQTLDNFSICLD